MPRMRILVLGLACSLVLFVTDAKPSTSDDSAKLVDSDVLPNTNSPLQFELTRLSNGTWLPSLASINTYGRESAFEDVKFDFRYEWRDFKLFTTSVDKVEIKPE